MKKLFLFAITIALLASSCKKTDCPAPLVIVPPVEMSGTTWNGLANFPGLTLANVPMVIIFNSNGTLGGSITNAGSSFAIAGSWNLTPSSTSVKMFFTIVSVGGSYLGQATLNGTNTKLESGTATNATAPTANMNFVVTKS
jgi:hypothetical protein